MIRIDYSKCTKQELISQLMQIYSLLIFKFPKINFYEFKKPIDEMNKTIEDEKGMEKENEK